MTIKQYHVRLNSACDIPPSNTTLGQVVHVTHHLAILC